MKFDFSKYKQNKLDKWKKKQQWHSWFAWHPVKVRTFEYRWFEIVARRLDPYYAHNDIPCKLDEWDYSADLTVIGD